jgi:hypothetical protein
VSGISSIKLKFYDRRKRSTGEDNSLVKTDTKRLKHGERSGLETPVVHALTYEGKMLEYIFSVDELTH